ncbi:hypothetical protein L6164_016827 [Bauhinia variegata]|uniref:Uncharacterized protein n=1 Tax=Bauhinia variegata TaxID=167791 RepID=A0ACB9N6Q6_BAUVA|nr:hypothetical protein L6164_016827 [Bauhinia variegata]
MNFFRTDAESILSEIKHQEKQIKLKRRWLMGLPASEYEHNKFKRLKFLKNRLLPESITREDDASFSSLVEIFYESVKAYIEGGFGAIERENHVVQEEIQSIDVFSIKRITSCLNNLTTKGLYLLAMILTGDSVKFEKTLCKMKKIIKSYLSSVPSRKNLNHNQLEIFKRIFDVLSSPQNFRVNCKTCTSRSESCHAIVLKVLDGLEDLPYQTLVAMRRKLKGLRSVPQLQPKRQGWSKDHLVGQVRKISEEMLSQHGGDELEETLAKAMTIADLSQKLTIGCHDLFSEEFFQYSPEIKYLQKDIIEAIWLVKTVVRISVLKNLQLLIEPDAQIPNGSLRTPFVKLLTENLFECSDMDSIPKSLSKILDAIGKSYRGTHHGLFQKENFDEVDCILNMEELEESDEGNSDEDDDNSQLQEDRLSKDEQSGPTDSNYGVESIGEFVPSAFHQLASTPERNSLFSPFRPGGNSNGDSVRQPPKQEALNLDEDQYQGESKEQSRTYRGSKSYDSRVVSPDRGLDENLYNRCDWFEFSAGIGRQNGGATCDISEFKPTKDSLSKNKYLAVQDVCDNTSMLAYNLIGHLMEEFAKLEGLSLNQSQNFYLRRDKQTEDVQGKKQSSSVNDARGSAIVRVVKELIPSFPDSGVERLKMLMG